LVNLEAAQLGEKYRRGGNFSASFFWGVSGGDWKEPDLMNDG
jgi:hypothetical protein